VNIGLQKALSVSDVLPCENRDDGTDNLATGIRFHRLSTSSMPVYDAIRCFPSTTPATTWFGYLDSIQRADAQYLASRGVDANVTTASSAQKDRSILGIYSSKALRQRGRGADTVPLLIALWRLCLWSSAEGKAWSGGSNGQVRQLEDGEELLEGFKTVQGIMHTRW